MQQPRKSYLPLKNVLRELYPIFTIKKNETNTIYKTIVNFATSRRNYETSMIR